jgi:hypothetical protein
MAVHVDAIDSVKQGGPLAHVRSECRIASPPALADCDAAPAIKRIGIMTRILAPLAVFA